MKNQHHKKFILFFTVLALSTSAYAQSQLGRSSLQVTAAGFRTVRITGPAKGFVKRSVAPGLSSRLGLTSQDVKGRIVGQKTATSFIDTVPASLTEVSYLYEVVDMKGNTIATSDSTSHAWPEQLFPELVLPQHADWVAMYRKAWRLNWDNIVTSKSIPSRFTQRIYPKNGISYVWDACFSTLYRRYAAQTDAFPVMAELDDFYAIQAPNGYILRCFNWGTFTPAHGSNPNVPRLDDINPPLFAWCEWNNYEITCDTARLRQVLPHIVGNYDFMEKFMRTDSGEYLWNRFGSGWDNITQVQPHHDWVDLAAQQALVARYVARIANVTGDKDIEKRFNKEYKVKVKEMEKYWNADKTWYCSRAKDGTFTGKTIAGMWPVLSGAVSKKRIKAIIDRNLFNPNTFYTLMPLPTIARDENGYNAKGEYWRGGVWLCTSMMTIRGLEDNGFGDAAYKLARKTVEGMATVYRTWKKWPETIWECYAPEYPAPASHKYKENADKLGTVRGDFTSWAGNVINLLIEDVMGFRVDAPNNILHWDIRLHEDYGIRRLTFGKIVTNVEIKGNSINVTSNHPYTLQVTEGGKQKRFNVISGSNKFVI